MTPLDETLLAMDKRRFARIRPATEALYLCSIYVYLWLKL